MNIKANDLFEKTIEHWKYVAPIVHEPHNQKDYDQLSELLDHLLDLVGENEAHPLIGLVDIVSHLIELYDERQEYASDWTSGVEALKFLMKQHHLKQADLPEIGSQGVVSEVLNGKRSLTLNQIKRLADRFHVSINTFID